MDVILDRVEKITLLRLRETHHVYRICAVSGNYILKCFLPDSNSKEIQVYSLLQDLGVPILPCYQITDHAIVLEDLDSSRKWRCARETDMKLAATGHAVANWYLRLHAVGLEVLGNQETNPAFLQPWVDLIELPILERVGINFDLIHSPGWNLALLHYEEIKEKYESFPVTFNYNDFAAENLALSAETQDKLQAIVYDYDQFCLGAAYSDWRNVVYSLEGEARESFIGTYGEVSEDERRMDDVLSVLQGLIVASERPKFPSWAISLLDSIKNGDFEQKIQTALEII